MAEAASVVEETNSVRTEDSEFTKDFYFSDWEVKARMEQTFFYLTLGDRAYDVYSEGESQLLMRKLAFALFGPPLIECHHSEDLPPLPGYSETENITSKFVFDRVMSLAGLPAHIAVIFVCVESKNSKSRLAAVFRVKKADGSAAFVDSFGKIYHSWADFLSNNRLPVGKRFCYPTNGVYSCENYDEYCYRDWGRPSISFGYKEIPAEGMNIPKRWFVGRSGVDVLGLCGETRLAIEAAMKAPMRSNFGDMQVSSTAAEYVKELLQGDLYCEFPGSKFERRTSYRCLHGLPMHALRLTTVMIVLEIAYLIEYFIGGDMSTLDCMRFNSGTLFFANEVIDVRTTKKLVRWGSSTDVLPPGPDVKASNAITGEACRGITYIKDAEPFNNFRNMKVYSISGLSKVEP